MLIAMLLIIWLAFPPAVELPKQPITAGDLLQSKSAPGPLPACPPICPSPPPGDSN